MQDSANIQVKMRSLVVLSGVIVALLLCSTVQAQKESPIPLPEASGTCCTGIKNKMPEAKSGIYMIRPNWEYPPFEVYCEMRPDGGWTVFQRRTGQTISFEETWAHYRSGFGELTGDHWLGLDKVHQLTEGPVNSVLRVELMDYGEGKVYAQYNNFQVGSEETNFQLHVGEYKGTAGDAIRGVNVVLENQNGLGFSTKDRNKGCKLCFFFNMAVPQCSKLEGNSGWWFSKCGSANLNGKFNSFGNYTAWLAGVHWDTWIGGTPLLMKQTKMMIKYV